VGTTTKLLSNENLDTIFAVHGLATMYESQGRLKEARVLLRRVTEAESRVLGDEHQDTLLSNTYLAATYQKQGRWKEAGALFVNVSEAMSIVLGGEHPLTLMIKGDLARTYRQQERFEEAETLFVGLIKAMSRLIGEGHPDTLLTVADLAYNIKQRVLCRRKIMARVMRYSATGMTKATTASSRHSPVAILAVFTSLTVANSTLVVANCRWWRLRACGGDEGVALSSVHLSPRRREPRCIHGTH
jgi:hypothetical protein